jgi:threonine dehydrogenase-like Zn-dependent dehydrogenase
VKALVMERRVTRFVAARLASAFGSGRGASVGPLRFAEVDPPGVPAAGFVALSPLLSGICGSDLATIDGRSSRYFEDLVSFPFVLGHEVLAVVEHDAIDATGAPCPKGTRVVVQPVLGCLARGLAPCDACATGETGRCQHLTEGHVRPGLQTGFCADTGGGWSEGPMWAHTSQLYAVPDALSDEDAVTVEPMACAVHVALRADIGPEDTVAVIGAGTLGLGVIAAIGFLAETGRAPRPSRLLVGARYRVQQAFARALGADDVVAPEQLARAVRLATRAGVVGPPSGAAGMLAGGADVVIDCVGSAESLAESLSICAPGGRVVLVGMPGRVGIDLAPLWHREITLTGAYAYGLERTARGPERTFDLAIEMAAARQTGRMVSARYPLDRFEEALAHAGSAGPRGAIKIVFDARARRAKPTRED